MIDFKAAKRHFKKSDLVMAELLEQALNAQDPIIAPQPKREREYFSNIVRSIVSQQISTAAASAVNSRVRALLVEITPKRVLEIDFDTLKACGLSAKKTEYIKHNAGVWHEIPTGNFVQMTDEEVIKELTKLYGIGRWTAEMFLIFSLARPNVFSYGDLGLMNSLYKNYQYKPHHVRKVAKTIESWSPHQTVASLTLWHQLDNGPVIL